MGTGPGYGEPDGPMPPYEELRESTFCAFGDLDASPTKAEIATPKSGWDNVAFFNFAFGRRPGEELYDLESDPHQMTNLAGNADFAKPWKELAERLDSILKATGDPRVTGDGQTFEKPPFTDTFQRPARKPKK